MEKLIYAKELFKEDMPLIVGVGDTVTSKKIMMIKIIQEEEVTGLF